jgi:BASS family bile acid:Na+ symporter
MFDTYLSYEYYFAAAQLMLAMLGMGATLRVADFAEVFHEGRALLLGLTTQLVVVPLIAYLVAVVLPVDAGIAVGLALVAAVPGGTMSNIVTHLAWGNTALSISMTTASTLGCLLTTPIVLRALAAAHLTAEFEMPAARIASDIGICLLLPLALGMFVGARMPHLRKRFSNTCIAASIGVILLMIVGSAGAGRIDATAYGWVGPAAIVVFSLLAQQSAMALGRLARLSGPDRLAIGVEVTIRNTNLALLIKASLFPVAAGVADPVADGALFVALLYGGFALFVALPSCLSNRRLELARVASEPSTLLETP